MPSEYIAPAYELADDQPPGTGLVWVNRPQRGAEHFVAWGIAIDQALSTICGEKDAVEPKQLSLNARVKYYEVEGEDPGWVVGYGAEVS